MKRQSVRSYVLVGVQFVCMGAILVSGPWVAGNGWFFTLELSGILLVVWAIFTMRITKVNVFPEVRTGAGWSPMVRIDGSGIPCTRRG